MTLETEQSIIYVTRDFERAAALRETIPGGFIISNSSSIVTSQKEDKHLFLVEHGIPLDTAELLEQSDVVDFISSKPNPAIIVFKNTPHIERLCAKRGWTLLNPPAELANRVEEKISQVEWLGVLRNYLPNASILTCKEIVWKQTPFILQFNRSHTGSGTHHISSATELKKIQEVFPNRPARVSNVIEGPVFTSNNVVTKNNTLIGNISYQITGLPPFTNQPFATIGNDWGVVDTLLSQKQKNEFRTMTKAIGKKLREDGWKGLFGVDIILEKKTGKLFLIEINARQPASTTYESELQRKTNTAGMTTFEAHIAALLDIDSSEKNIIEITDGAQIILRNPESDNRYQISDIKKTLEANGFHVIEYKNTKPGSDLLRIQSTQSIMNRHGEFSESGKRIVNIITMQQDNNDQHALSGEAIAVIDQYLHLPFKNKTVSCPYFNNRRNNVRAGLRVLVGKGTPKEIVEEAELIALREKIDLASLPEIELKRFLIDHNLGIDCSALAYHILDKELSARGKGSIKTYLSFSHIKNPLRRLLARLRSVENTGVKTLARNENSSTISLSDICPGDMITMIASKGAGAPDHVLLVHAVEKENGVPKIIHYTHALQWSTDGQYNHGVRQGRIEITDPNKALLEQSWIEQEKTGKDNETQNRAASAKTLETRRLVAIQIQNSKL